MTTFTGAIQSLTAGTTTLSVPVNNHRDALKALSEAWTAFVPTWTGTTNPAIGNGTITGRYAQIDKTVLFELRITMGSTTTYGTGNWNIGFPVASSANYVNNQAVASGAAFDTSATLLYPLSANKFGTTMFATGPAGTTVSPTVPFTWATGDILSICGSYEAA